MVGPTRVSPKKSARRGAPTRAKLLVEHHLLEQAEPLAPVLVGQLAQIHPPAKSLAVHSSLKVFALLGVMEKPGSPQPAGRFSCSQWAMTPRNSSASGG